MRLSARQAGRPALRAHAAGRGAQERWTGRRPRAASTKSGGSLSSRPFVDVGGNVRIAQHRFTPGRTEERYFFMDSGSEFEDWNNRPTDILQVSLQTAPFLQTAPTRAPLSALPRTGVRVLFSAELVMRFTSRCIPERLGDRLSVSMPDRVLAYYRAALAGLRYVESRRPSGRRFGENADALWKNFAGELTVGDRLDLHRSACVFERSGGGAGASFRAARRFGRRDAQEFRACRAVPSIPRRTEGVICAQDPDAPRAQHRDDVTGQDRDSGTSGEAARERVAARQRAALGRLFSFRTSGRVRSSNVHQTHE